MRWLPLTLTVLLLAASLAAEDSPTLKVTAAFDPAKAEIGAEVKFKLTFEVEAGFHAYHKDNEGIGTPLKASLTDLAGLEQVGDVAWPKYKVKSDPDFGDEWVLEGSFDLTWKFKVPKDAKGTLKLKGKYSAQVCDEEGCHMREGKFEASLAVEDKKPDEKKPDTPKDGKNSRADADGWAQNTGLGIFAFEEPAAELIDAAAGNWPSDLPSPPSEGVKSRFSMTPRLSPRPSRPGDEVTLELSFETFDLDHGSGFNYLYHPQTPYGKGLALVLKHTPGLSAVGDWQYPAYKVKPGDEFTDNKESWVWDKKFVISRKLKLAADAKPGQYTLTATATGQVCDEGGCLPFNFGWLAEFEVAAPEAPAKAKTKNIAGLDFFVNYDDAVAEARKLNKLVLLDFNGVNCPPCRQMEGRVFTRGDVKPLMMNFVLVSLVTDIDENLREKELFAKYRPRPTTPIPLYVIVDVEGKELRQIGATLKEPTRFVDFLRGTGESSQPPQPGPGNGAAVVKPAEWPKDLPAPATRENTKTKDDPKTPGAFTLSARFTADKVRPGGEVTLELNFETFDIGGGLYHFYHPASPWNPPFKLVLKDAGGLEPKGDWEYPKHHVVAPTRDNGMDKEAWVFGGKFALTRRFKVPDSAKPGDQFAAQGTWTGQICDNSGCVSFDALDIIFGYHAVLTADAAGAQSAIALPTMEYSETKSHPLNPPSQPENKLDEEINKAGGLWLWLLAAFGFGALTLLTPCVLPVLPMTVGFFVKQAEQKRSPLVTAGIYCACIIGSFTAFGLITSLLLGEQGAQIIATNGWVNLAIGLLFVVFALSFFGLFELRVPTFISSKLSRATFNAQREGRGYVTALLNGSSFSVITFSCTAPIAAAFLAGAVSGSMWTATLTMLVYSAGMALPIFIFGMFPSLLKKMPKSGGWMNALKVVFAFIELAIAIRYFSWAEIAFRQVVVPEWISRNMVDAVWIACFAAAGLYLLGLFRLPHDHEKVEQIGVVRLMFATLFISFSLFLLPGLLSGQRMGLLDGFLPPRPASHGGGGNGHSGGADLHALKWYTDLDEALVEARQTGKPVFVDFTGIICSNCRWVETNIMPENPVISQLAKDFVLVQQWTDKDGDNKAKARWKEFGGRAVPFYVVLGPDGKEIDRLVPPNFINSLTVQQFAEFLQRSKTRGSVAK